MSFHTLAACNNHNLGLQSVVADGVVDFFACTLLVTYAFDDARNIFILYKLFS